MTLFRSLVAFLLACLAAPIAAAGPQVQVWRIGSPHRGDTPPATLPPTLIAEADRLGFQLSVRVMPAKDFARAFFAARATNDEPDILVIDNMGLIIGIDTPLGHFDGIGADPNVNAALVKVSQALKPLESRSGWQFLLRTSKHFAEAKALATRPIDCGPSKWTDASGGVLSTAAEQATLAYFRGDEAGFGALTIGSPTDTQIHLPHEPRSVVDVRVCGGWGNERLAFTQTTTSFEASDEIGYRTFLAAVATVDGQARVLMLGDSPKVLDMLAGDAPTLLNGGDAQAIAAPTVLSPDDGASATRMPPNRRPMLVWTASGAAFYLVEWQFGSPKGDDWQGSGFTFVAAHRQADGPVTTMTATAPFGVGHQPHRWRIWAISSHGDVARSPWRTLFFTN